MLFICDTSLPESANAMHQKQCRVTNTETRIRLLKIDVNIWGQEYALRCYWKRVRDVHIWFVWRVSATCLAVCIISIDVVVCVCVSECVYHVKYVHTWNNWVMKVVGNFDHDFVICIRYVRGDKALVNTRTCPAKWKRRVFSSSTAQTSWLRASRIFCFSHEDQSSHAKSP